MGQAQEDQGKREEREERIKREERREKKERREREREKQDTSHPLCIALAIYHPVREGGSPETGGLPRSQWP